MKNMEDEDNDQGEKWGQEVGTPGVVLNVMRWVLNNGVRAQFPRLSMSKTTPACFCSTHDLKRQKMRHNPASPPSLDHSSLFSTSPSSYLSLPVKSLLLQRLFSSVYSRTTAIFRVSLVATFSFPLPPTLSLTITPIQFSFYSIQPNVSFFPFKSYDIYILNNSNTKLSVTSISSFFNVPTRLSCPPFSYLY
jgi:hypothetical protein